MSEARLTIREVVARTGVEAATLRMWEQRHGFPEPYRRPSGHRRYSQRDVDLVLQILGDRESGLELRAAIEKAKRSQPGGGPVNDDSIYAGLRRRRPDLVPYVLPKRVLVELSHAIEDECSARAQRPLLIGSFQRERFYRRAEARWRDLAGPAECAIAIADFDRLQEPAGGPIEVPIDRSEPIGCEWAVICEARDFTAMLAARERPGQDEAPDAERDFEMFWCLEPELVRQATLAALAIMERCAAPVVAPLRQRLERPLEAHRLPIEPLTALTSRMVAYAAGATRLPAPHSSAGA